MVESAKSIVLNPLFKAIMVANADTPAECELGIPPVSKKVLHSHLPVLKNFIGILRNCATVIALKAILSGRFKLITSCVV